MSKTPHNLLLRSSLQISNRAWLYEWWCLLDQDHRLDQWVLPAHHVDPISGLVGAPTLVNWCLLECDGLPDWGLTTIGCPNPPIKPTTCDRLLGERGGLAGGGKIDKGMMANGVTSTFELVSMPFPLADHSKLIILSQARTIYFEALMSKRWTPIFFLWKKKLTPGLRPLFGSTEASSVDGLLEWPHPRSIEKPSSTISSTPF